MHGSIPQLRPEPPRRRALGGLLLTLASLAVPVPVAAELLAGVAAVDITPPVGGSLYGYGARGDNVSTGVHDRLFAKALVLRSGDRGVAIVNLDLGSFDRAHAGVVRQRVEQEVALDAVLLVASHTHSAPRLEAGFPAPDRSYPAELERKIAAAVIEAAKSTRPATLRYAEGGQDGCHNRRQVLDDGSVRMRWANRDGEPTSPIDPTVRVVAVDDDAGEPIATLVGFACHPVVLGPENLEVSADYPGAMMQAVEAATGGQAMFLQGAAGDINPHWDKTPPADGAFERLAELAGALAAEVLRIRPAAQPLDGDTISVGDRAFELEPRWDVDSPEVRAVFERRGAERLFEYYRSRFQQERSTSITTVLVGSELGFAFFPGEFFVEHGLRLTARAAPLLPNVLFVGYTNGELGYFPTIEAAAQGGYGATEATLVEVGAGERMVDAALEMLLRQAGALRDLPP